jgi:phosphoserine phosphatase RsbU/P
VNAVEVLAVLVRSDGVGNVARSEMRSRIGYRFHKIKTNQNVSEIVSRRRSGVITAPIPAGEAERLADLRALKILDTPPEERFDRIVRLAQRIFGVPIAYIALVGDDRQWFKAKCGLNFDSTGRDVSFCGHTILHNGPLIVPDAHEDVRFRDNPLVVNPPYVRFYAGHPLKGPGGHNVGTLCLAAPAPRNLTAAEQSILAELARLAEHELNMIDVIHAQRELLETKEKLLATQQQLAGELAEAAAYIKSLLPPKLDGAVRTDWAFITSSQLGGDMFGYHWLDPDRLAIYLHDVCGHGVSASLLSIAVYNSLRRQSLPNVRFDDPAAVLAGLNQVFPMEQNQDKFVTMWYGVFQPSSRTLRYSSAGHPPALMFNGRPDRPSRLGEPSLPIGAADDAAFETQIARIPPHSRLYVYSDGVSEIDKPGGGMLEVQGLSDLLAQAACAKGSRVERVLSDVRELQGSPEFRDDFSLVEVEFN